MRYLVGFIVITLFIGCLSDRDPSGDKILTQEEKLKVAKEKNLIPPAPKYLESIPDACTLITPEEISMILGPESSSVILKDSSNPDNEKIRSCFFKWVHDGAPNSGIFLQVQSNPIPDEFPQWASSFIDAKKSSGEKTFGDSADTFLFKKFNIGIDGAYNYALGKYFWRVDDNNVFMLAFNIDVNEGQQLEWAEQIANKTMEKL